MLRLFNSLTKEKEIFKSIRPNEISMYVCGVTVYDHCHLGHARYMIVFDMIFKYLQHLGYSVNYISNITDVDDKIIRKAISSAQSSEQVAETYISSMIEDMQALHVSLPSHQPKATMYIPEMLAMIATLMDKGYAYRAKNGDICFSVEKFESYARLSRQDLEQLRAGARVDVVEDKASALDFVLWKRSKEHEPSWDAPWGPGRPGWHIECSAMAAKLLGPHIDIHGGGLDLQFPHHENEIAQSEACFGETLANYWLHVGLLQLNDEKMSKSTGNFLSIKDALKLYPAEVIRLFFMSCHYRSPLNYNDQSLQQFHKTLQRLYQTLNNIPATTTALNTEYLQRFETAMNDDFNTPDALSVIFELNNEINKDHRGDLIASLKYMGQLLGFLYQEPQDFLQAGHSDMSEAEILLKIAERKQARQDKNFQKADDIRQYLLQHGIELEDKADGTSWRRSLN